MACPDCRAEPATKRGECVGDNIDGLLAEYGSWQIYPSEGALIRFLFRVLSKLQSLGTVPAIDWAAYAA